MPPEKRRSAALDAAGTPATMAAQMASAMIRFFVARLEPTVTCSLQRKISDVPVSNRRNLMANQNGNLG